jgi:hypothetical protein
MGYRKSGMPTELWITNNRETRAPYCSNWMLYFSYLYSEYVHDESA